MKKLLSSLILALIVSMYAMAQDMTITGTVTAREDGLAVPGASVLIKGKTSGTATGSDGRYSIQASKGDVLTFSFIGYTTQEFTIGSQSTINVVLSTDAKQLTEVVVTALGLSKEKKTLGYSTTTVRSDEINRTSAVSLFGGVQGKVAGVNISNTSGSPGGTTKVIIRGYHSITNNAPLYVVDGVPLDNSTPGGANKLRPGGGDNVDFGNNANDIDPNDIDNTSILKGSAATALYGSRGANGVILITTKKGRAGKPKVDFNTSTTITNLAQIYTPQKTYGQGWDGTFILSENGNWGPAYTGQLRPGVLWLTVLNC